jgi:hypothetical protein
VVILTPDKLDVYTSSVLYIGNTQMKHAVDFLLAFTFALIAYWFFEGRFDSKLYPLVLSGFIFFSIVLFRPYSNYEKRRELLKSGVLEYLTDKNNLDTILSRWHDSKDLDELKDQEGNFRLLVNKKDQTGKLIEEKKVYNFDFSEIERVKINIWPRKLKKHYFELRRRIERHWNVKAEKKTNEKASPTRSQIVDYALGGTLLSGVGGAAVGAIICDVLDSVSQELQKEHFRFDLDIKFKDRKKLCYEHYNKFVVFRSGLSRQKKMEESLEFLKMVDDLYSFAERVFWSSGLPGRPPPS